MNPHVFREYDIRGVAERDLTDEFTRALGRALGTFQMRAGHRQLAVGRDCRTSSDRLHEELVRGLLEAGVHVVDVGVVPTPLMYFAVHHLDLDGGVEITGSHNPPPENGFKMMKGKGSLFGDDIRALKRMIEEDDYDLPGGGTVEQVDVLPSYLGFLRGNVRLARTDLRIALDAGNGAAGPTAVAAMEALGLEPIALLCKMDGRFPVHHPDPTDPESLELLIRKVKDEGLDLGIAFDGDGDRIGVVDAEGGILWGDQLLTLLSRELLADHPGAAVLGEVKCSQTLYDDIAKHGGRPILWKTGHSLIKTKMKEEGALLAGEMSGHLFFADRYYGFDDAVYAAARLLELLARADRPLHQLLVDVPETHTTPELRVECPDDEKFAVVEKVRDRFAAEHDVITVDGARIQFGDGAWGLVRASNTQPVLVLRFEARTPERRDAIRAEVEQAVAEARA
ncbi:MAG TPA: phosphomannomutase/phosphoglucomutase [Polyangiaceae bacterium LLY-WYZ-15_(1-7)]|nr:phosphomannomutase [Sandaracinus sp.]MBJ69869.1 phosphomannomutase [Sandaracinus sp.]HJL03349.1 phosphomannomutase/phosphoglucomutase [Polyangiaceae bacterium LLY-WYZ-15_(1-7)]HJL10632.1 phosphomannomutase/phosphoglucomutase [Polyangiaceae bacterium LLY-WYZ-15_(1-7)]HJL23846.1 phosphomannomutase/phosphoglucomutase [Polyangiaceae bacterium LLY-WYZ-15_(1-7)]